MLHGHYRGQLAMAYYSKLKARTQLNGKLLQGFTAATKQLAHKTLVTLPKDYIQKKAAYASPRGEAASSHGP
jgi:hypothetical protein